MRSLINRPAPRRVALETTLLAHGVPSADVPGLAADLAAEIRGAGATPCVIGVLRGTPIVGMSDAELAGFLADAAGGGVAKANTSNLGALIARGRTAATTVSATMELASRAGVRVFATGGLGGVHRGATLDVSSDLTAFTRFPVCVVASGAKAILDVPATREALEALGVPVVGFRAERFPAFYLRDGGAGVDASFDDVLSLASYVGEEIARTSRGVLVVQPVPPEHEISAPDWSRWLAAAEARASEARGRDVTPALLAALHEVSGGATLRANLALVRANARLAGRIAAVIEGDGGSR